MCVNKKFISFCMAAVMAANAVPVTIYAASVGSDATQTSIGEDTVQSVKTQYSQFELSDAQTAVYLTVDDSNLVVSVPTTIVLSGTPDANGQYKSEYSVKVSGDISGDKQVTVEPESDNVALKQKWKNDKTATINQQQVLFGTNDFKGNTVTTGTVKAESLTAGSWNGNFNFNISYNNENKVFDGYTVLYRYDLSATKDDDVYAYYLVPSKNTEAVRSDGSISRVKSRSRAKAPSTTNVIEHNGIKYTLSDNDKLVITGDGSVKSNIINDLGDQEAIQKAVQEYYKDEYPTETVNVPSVEEWNNMSLNERENLKWYTWEWHEGSPTLTKHYYQKYTKNSNNSSWSVAYDPYGNIKDTNSVKIGLSTFRLKQSTHTSEYEEIMKYKNSIASNYSISCPKTVTLGQGITAIGNNSFSGLTSLETVEVSSGLKKIGINAFNGCINLKNIKLNDGLESIGGYAFSGCKSLREIQMPTTVNQIGDCCFENCSRLTRFDFNNCQITHLSTGLLRNTLVYSVVVPDTVTSIGSYALFNVKHVELPNGVTNIGSYALYNANDVYLPLSVKSLGTSALNTAAVVYVSNENISLGSGSIVGNSAGKIYCPSQNLADKVDSINKLLTTDKKSNFSPSVVATDKFNANCINGHHSYEITQDGNCTDLSNISYSSDIKEQNVKIYTCTDCGHKKYELNPNSHNFQFTTIRESTCTDSGINEGICANCNCKIQKYLPVTEHQYENGVCIKCGKTQQ